MVARSLFLLAGIFAAARSQAPVGGPHGRKHVARYLRGEGREDEEAAPTLHYFASPRQSRGWRRQMWSRRGRARPGS